MESNRLTVKDMKNLARMRGLRGYSRLRQDQLINLLSNPGPPILDRDSENIGAPVLRPTIASPPTVTRVQVTPSNQQQQLNNLLKSLEGVRAVPKSISFELAALKDKIKKLYSNYEQIKLEKNNSALKDWAKEYKIRGIKVLTPHEFLNFARPEMVKVLENNRNTKIKMVLQCMMTRIGDKNRVELVETNFSSDINEINLAGSNAGELYDVMIARILENFQSFVMEGSGWGFVRVKHLKLHTAVYEPLRATGHIKLPDWVLNKKACINPKNNDNKCFLWCVLIALEPKKVHPERIDNDLRSKENSLNMGGIKYPVTTRDIDKFEKQNPEISVNVFSFNEGGKKFYPLRITKNKRDKHVDLLYFKNEINSHYAVIKDFSRLMSSPISNKKNKKYFCKRCANPFGSENVLQKHEKLCDNHEAVFLKMPKEGRVLKFENHYKKIEFPIAIYADFESVLLPVETRQPSEKKSYTIKRQKHVPCSFYYIIIFSNGIGQPIERNYTGKDADKIFMRTLIADVKKIVGTYHEDPVPIKISEEEEIKHERETNCYICNEEFTPKNYKVKDHCHFTGKYRGAAHAKCNLKAKIPNFTPVYFHNLSSYDAHLFIKILGKTYGNIDCIPINEEKYISFSKTIWVGKKNGIKSGFSIPLSLCLRV